MKPEQFIEIFQETSKNMFVSDERCGLLHYAKMRNGSGFKIREPEATQALIQVLYRRGIEYGVEVPTMGLYAISTDKQDAANTDIVLFTETGQINIEFKEGSCHMKHIQKDIMKMLGEDVAGCAFFHVLKNTNRGTLPNLMAKYEEAYHNNLSKERRFGKWFVLHIHVAALPEGFFSAFIR
jgi:hypothetical protein